MKCRYIIMVEQQQYLDQDDEGGENRGRDYLCSARNVKREAATQCKGETRLPGPRFQTNREGGFTIAFYWYFRAASEVKNPHGVTI